MPFVSSYNKTMKLLEEIESGKCSGTCKSIWIRNFKYALKTKSNPLKLNTLQRKLMTKKLKSVSGRNSNKKTNKKLNRPSPSYPANDYCGKNKKGNDGNMYTSIKNKNGICRWVKLK